MRHLLLPSVVSCLLVLGSGWTAEPNTAQVVESGGEEAPSTGQSTAQTTRYQERTDHLTRIGVHRWHTAGYRGQGVTIALLDRGFRGYRAFLGTLLPAQVVTRSFRDDGDLEAHNGQHGLLCAEVLHAIAPDARLLFADWDQSRPDSFLAAVRWAREQGASIISSSVVTPSWSDGEGGGTIHQELAHILGLGDHRGDVLCFASAGNMRDRHWAGTFKDGGQGFHEWIASHTDNDLSPWGEELVCVEMYGRGTAEYELSVSDSKTEREVDKVVTTIDAAGRNSAAIRFIPVKDHTYKVRIRKLHGGPTAFHIATTRASLNYTTEGSNVCFPADGPEVVAMGAVDREGHRRWYSACGPNSPSLKPDLVATIPFPLLCREQTFGGTSAAAPQAAALAALWLSRYPAWTPAKVRTALQANAQDLGPTGPDVEMGYGLIRLPQLLSDAAANRR